MQKQDVLPDFPSRDQGVQELLFCFPIFFLPFLWVEFVVIDSLLFQVRQQLREATEHVQNEDSVHSSGSEVTQVRVPGRENAPCKAFWELSDTAFLSLSPPLAVLI